MRWSACLLLLVLMVIGAVEANYTFATRGVFFGADTQAPAKP